MKKTFIIIFILLITSFVSANPGARIYPTKSSTPLSLKGLFGTNEAVSSSNSYAYQMVSSGNSMYTIGSVMAFGGLGAQVLGNVINEGSIAGIGGLVNIIGVTVLGFAAGKLATAAKELNPDGFLDTGSGWGWYLSGFGLQVGGLLVLVASIDVNMTASDVIVPIGMMVSGLVCYYVSWYRFSVRKDASNMAIGAVSTLKLEPIINLAENPNNNSYGVQLSLNF